MARFTDYVLGAAVVTFGAFVAGVNASPDKMPVVPGLSQIAPVVTQVTQNGITETKFISHYDVHRIKILQNVIRQARVDQYRAQQRLEQQSQFANAAECSRYKSTTECAELFSF